MTEKPVKTRAQSTQGLLAIKAGLVKTKLESRRSRTEDGTPVLSYTAIKEAGSSTKINSRAIRESRSFSDPDIYQSLVIFSDAQGLFSMANNVSSFKGVQKVNNKQIPSERPVFTAQKENQRKDHVKNLGFSFEKVSSGFDSKHHLAEFSNPLHKGNQPRFRKGGGVLPSKPSVLPKPVVAPKPPKRLTQDTPTISDDLTKSYPKEEADSLSESSPYCDTEEDNDPSYASISRERPSIPNHPPPRKLINKPKDSQEAKKDNKTDENGTESCTEVQQQKGDNEQESESQPSVAPLYAQVDKTKKKPHLKNINSDSKISNRMVRSDSDPLPSNISIASGMIYEIREEEESNVKQSSLENEIDIVSESDSEDGWDPEDFDDDDSSDDDDSRPNSKGETMHFPDQRSKKLYNIAHEILTTERAYVKRLHLLDKVFCFRLHNECFAHGIITADVLPDIFSNISSIHSFHKDFLLPKLEERMSQWNTDNRIGDILKTLAPFLKLYTAYIANFDKSSETLSTWTKKSPKFAAIIEEIQKSKDCENLTLGHHMLEPIQRVPRYKLLLKDYLSKLPEDSPDYKDTQDAMGIISEAAAHANDSMKKTEIFKKLLELQERVIEDYDLIAAGRQFIKEGDLTKVSARHVAHQERTLLLFNDVLLCCGKLPGTNKLKVKVEMDLYGMEIGETDDEVELCNTFRVTSKQKVIDFSASSETEREAWILAINDAILEISQKRESYRRGTKPDSIKESELGKKAPVWVRDEAVTMCMSCDTLFTLTRRRHHCRACGEIFCNPCSRLKSHLEYSRKIERVCEKCHKSLAKGATASFSKKSEDEKRHHDVRKISRDCKVLLSGYLNYKSGKGGDKGWAKRWCVLSDTFEFYCYKAKKDQKADFSLPLPGYIVDKPNMADNLDKKIAFKLHHKNFVVYYFSSDSHEVLDSWIHNLSYAVKAERIPETETEESEQATVES